MKLPKFDNAKFKDYDMCYGCGQNNPIGLKLEFDWDGQTARALFKPEKTHQGWEGLVHGGITACVLDEAMGQTALFAGCHNVTAKMQIRYKKLVPVDAIYEISCSIIRKTSRLIETEARLTATDGTVMAEATSIQYIVNK